MRCCVGTYVVLERLGSGGMGNVFKARHQKLGRIVALKVIQRDKLDNPAVVKRFLRESAWPRSSIIPTSSTPTTPRISTARTSL